MRFDRFVSSLAIGNVREAVQALVGPEGGNFCSGRRCSSGNQNCPVGCFCNTNQNKCVGTK